MSFKEIASYAFGGIGAYLIVCMSIPCILGATNVFLSGTLGIGLTDMYIMYVIGVLSGIPLTGVRANIVDNTRNKAGKYRPYLLRMGIPCAIIFVLMVWFPYDKLSLIVGSGQLFGRNADYVAKCAIILAFNIALQFFYYFFYDAYENLIHVLSPNSQERADVASIKSIIYSFGPTVYNIIIPLIAAVIGTNQTDIKVYRIAFPVIGVIGTLLVFVVYANTQEKIIQAKTHVIQIKFTDALREVAKISISGLFRLPLGLASSKPHMQIFFIGFATTAVPARRVHIQLLQPFTVMRPFGVCFLLRSASENGARKRCRL